MKEPVSEFTASVFAAVDAMDPDKVAARFASDGRLVFGNQPALVGPEQIRVGNAAFFGQIQGIHHTVVHEWVVGSDTIVERLRSKMTHRL